MADWAPEQGALGQLVELLQNTGSADNRVQQQVNQRLASFNNVPEYGRYLVYILTQMPTQQANVRTVAGLLLKNLLRVNWDTIPPDVVEYVKACVLQALGDSEELVRSTAGTVITTIISRGGLLSWREVMPRLMELLAHQDMKVVEGTFSALQKICEDSSRALDSDEAGRPLNFMIPRIITFFDSPSVKVRASAIACINQFILGKSQSLMANLEQFVQALYARANDAAPPVRKQVCQALVMLLEVRPDQLLPSLDSVVSFMLYCTQDEDESVALEACEFWLAFAEQDELRDHLEPHIKNVIPVLLKGMVYTDDDVAILVGADEDADVPDQDKDIKPRHHKAKTHAFEHVEGAAKPQQVPQFDEDGEQIDEDEDEDDEDEDDVYQEWNLRKCSAAALDVLATVYGDDLLEILLPLLQERLRSQDWKERECAVLALGAVAEGCQAMDNHLNVLVPFLVGCLNDRQPLIRSITCWTLGRYARWIVNAPAEDYIAHKHNYFEPVLQGLLAMVLDNNKRVQEAGCSAFATLEEEACDQLVPYLGPILQTLVAAFGKYQHKNLLILYDAVGTLADSVGGALNTPEHVQTLMGPLTERWNRLRDADRDIFPLLECLSSVAVALGPGFAPFAPPVWERCLNLIQSTLQAEAMYQQDPNLEAPDKDFMIVALDLLSGIAQGLGPSVDGLVANSNPPLMPLLNVCMQDAVSEVRQSAYALLGDLAISAFPRLEPYLSQLLPEVINQIEPIVDQLKVSVCNNAAWAAGEIALQYGPRMEPYVTPLLSKLIPLLQTESNSRTLLENAAITIGRLGLVCPQLVAPYLETFAEPWCKALRNIRDNPEKESAFQGLCKLIEVNPNGIIKSFVYFCDAVTQWNRISPQLNESFKGILYAFKNSMNQQQWDHYVAQYPIQVRNRLHERYQL
ncbi:Transportin-PC [Hyaloraphidium curvatum]|nr:Transportin-PC [Hyaloraphidium curvatum]